MNKPFFFLLSFVILFFNSFGQIKCDSCLLAPSDFSGQINKNPGAAVVDVRTPEEFAKGHLSNAVNIDWKEDNFATRISMLDKSKPVFVYCLGGSRSAAAAAQMRADGFSRVYELKGGILKWRAADLPESRPETAIAASMTRAQFDKLIKTDKLVLIHFYADWCSHCKKMKPYMDEIAREMKDKVTVIRISIDDNQALCKELQIDAVPIVRLYKDKQLVWINEGFIGKEEILKQLSKF